MGEEQVVEERKTDDAEPRATLFRGGVRILSVRNPSVPASGLFVMHGIPFLEPDELESLPKPDAWGYIWLGKYWRFQGSIKTVTMDGVRMWIALIIHDTPKEDRESNHERTEP